ncbi:MAG: dihydroorotate dehydrogenase-like protein [Pelovirga sp.]
MIDLSTNYMGLPLKNPLIIASCSLTGSIDEIKQCADAGAGAVVLPSLFEEQIRGDISSLSRHAEDYSGYGEAFQYLQSYASAFGPQEYLQLLREARKNISIPVIASLNCISGDSWAAYAQQLQEAGADAIELNVSIMPTDPARSCDHIVNEYLNILHQVKARVSLPVALKIGPYFTSFANVVERLTHDRAEAPAYSVGWMGKNLQVGETLRQGADALVLFNRYYQFDIDIDSQQLHPETTYSSPTEMSDMLRWLSLLFGKADCDLAASTGIHDGSHVVKALLAGATVTQLCSTLYLYGLGQVAVIEKQLRQWMERNNYSRLDDFRGRLSQKASATPKAHERVQYIKLFMEQNRQVP